MKYRVLINDTFGYMEQGQMYAKGEYSTYGEALAVCRDIVDGSLRHACAPGMPASALYFRYMIFGKEPYIVEDPESPDTSQGFSALDYARARCEQLCSRLGEESDQDVPNRPGSMLARR